MQDVYGSADVLQLADVDVPEPGAGEVLVRVRAAGVDRGVWHLMTGQPYIARLALGLCRPRNRVLGGDVAGVVGQVGPGVTGFAVGERGLRRVLAPKGTLVIVGGEDGGRWIGGI